MSVNIAEGNIISTPVDLAQWVRKLIRGEAGPNAASVAAMMTPTALSGNGYGLGLIVSPLGYGHNGAHAGYLSLMLYDPSIDVAAIIYCNVWDENNLTTAQLPFLTQVLRDARTALGY
jgi:D-alanyl-D-alanine carboxypeptidase